jgi:hypothetical protein
MVATISRISGSELIIALQHGGGGEDVPQRIALLGRRLDQPREHGLVRPVPGQQVEAPVVDRGGQRIEAVQDDLDLGVEVAARVRGGDVRHVPQPVEVLLLGRVQPQRTRDGVEHLHAGVDGPALLEPRVPGDADPGELGDLLAAQPGRASAGPGRQTGVARRDALAAAAQERRQFRPPPPGRDHVRHGLILSEPDPPCQVLPVPG